MFKNDLPPELVTLSRLIPTAASSRNRVAKGIDKRDDDEIIGEYLTAALEDGNPDVFLSAVGNVAKARRMSAIAESTGLGRESPYKAFAPGAKPRYDTVLKVLQSFGVKLNVTA
jgi:probable addiction module antidote protein